MNICSSDMDCIIFLDNLMKIGFFYKFLGLVGGMVISFEFSNNSFAEENNEVMADDAVKVCAIPQLYDYLEDLKKVYSLGKIDISYASSSMIYASVINNQMKCDIFLGNDQKFPARYITSGVGDSTGYGNFTKTTLALFSVTSIIDKDCDVLNKDIYNKIIMPNPKYNVSGFAASQIIELYIKKNPKIKNKVIYSDNEYSALSSIVNGYAMLGFLPYNMVVDNKMTKNGSFCLFSDTEYEPINYYYMTFKNSKNIKATNSFRDYLFSDKSRLILKKHGYK